MTAWILTDDTNEFIARSVNRSTVAREVASPVNFRAILDSLFQPNPSLFNPTALEGSSEPLPTLEDELIDSYLMDEEEPIQRSKGKEEESPTTNRFTSLREELSKAEGKPVRIELDPSDVLGYAFVKENQEGTSHFGLPQWRPRDYGV